MKPVICCLIVLLVPAALWSAMIGDIFIDDKDMDPSNRDFLLIIEGAGEAPIEIIAGSYAILVRDHRAVQQSNGSYRLPNKPVQLAQGEFLIMARGKKENDLKRFLSQGGLFLYPDPNMILGLYDHEIPAFNDSDPAPESDGATADDDLDGPGGSYNTADIKDDDETRSETAPPQRTVIGLLMAAIALIIVNIIISTTVLLRRPDRQDQNHNGV